eukprot:4504668-Lingulodinium_polyedra.AAC.1
MCIRDRSEASNVQPPVEPRCGVTMGFSGKASPPLTRESSLSVAGIPIFCAFRAVLSDLYLFLADGTE